MSSSRCLRRAFDWLLWQTLVDWSPEKFSGLAALSWGLWVLAFRFLEGNPGWHFLVALLDWQPLVSSSVAWGGAAAVLGFRQLHLASYTFELPPSRVRLAFVSGCVWAFFSVAILLSQPASTGFAIYGCAAWNSFAAYYQLSMRARGRGRLP